MLRFPAIYGKRPLKRRTYTNSYHFDELFKKTATCPATETRGSTGLSLKRSGVSTQPDIPRIHNALRKTCTIVISLN